MVISNYTKRKGSAHLGQEKKNRFKPYSINNASLYCMWLTFCISTECAQERTPRKAPSQARGPGAGRSEATLSAWAAPSQAACRRQKMAFCPQVRTSNQIHAKWTYLDHWLSVCVFFTFSSSICSHISKIGLQIESMQKLASLYHHLYLFMSFLLLSFTLVHFPLVLLTRHIGLRRENWIDQ